jgi:excisionase family DNA binding protein
MTVEEVAERVRVTTETVRRWLRLYRETKGEEGLRGYQLARRSGWRIREVDLRTFMERHVPGDEVTP